MRKVVRISLVLIGAFLLWILVALLAGTVAQLRVPVNLSSISEVRYVSDGFVRASGTWVIEGEAQAFPLQTTEIWCERDIKRCTSATAQVMSGEQMLVHLDFFDVVAWEKTRVVFSNDSPGCVDYIHTIDLVTKTATALRRKKLDQSKAIGDCSALVPELRVTLRKGSDVVTKTRNDALPWFGELVFAPLKLLR